MGSSFTNYNREMNMMSDEEFIGAKLDINQINSYSIESEHANADYDTFVSQAGMNFNPPATVAPSQLSINAGGGQPQMFGQASAFTTPPTLQNTMAAQQMWTVPPLPANVNALTIPLAIAAAAYTARMLPQAGVTNTVTPSVNVQVQAASTTSQKAKKPKAKKQKKQAAVAGPDQRAQTKALQNIGLGIMQPQHISGTAQQPPQGYQASTNPAHAHLLQAAQAQNLTLAQSQQSALFHQHQVGPPQAQQQLVNNQAQQQFATHQAQQHFATPQNQQFGHPQAQQHFATPQNQQFGHPQAQQHFAATGHGQQSFGAVHGQQQSGPLQFNLAHGSSPAQQLQNSALQTPLSGLAVTGSVQQSLPVNQITSQAQLSAPITKRKRADSDTETKRPEKLFLAPNSTLAITEDGDLISPFQHNFLNRMNDASIIEGMEYEDDRVSWETSHAQREECARLAAAQELEDDLAAALQAEISTSYDSNGLGLGDDDTLMPGFEDDQGLAEDPEEEISTSGLSQEPAGMDAEDFELFQALSDHNNMGADNNPFEEEDTVGAVDVSTASTSDNVDDDQYSLVGEDSSDDSSSLFGDECSSSAVASAAVPVIKALPKLCLPKLPVEQTSPTSKTTTLSLPKLPSSAQKTPAARQLYDTANALTHEDRDFAIFLGQVAGDVSGPDSISSTQTNGIGFGGDEGIYDGGQVQNNDIDGDDEYDESEDNPAAANPTQYNMGGSPAQIQQFAVQQQQQQTNSLPQQSASQQQYASQQQQYTSPAQAQTQNITPTQLQQQYISPAQTQQQYASQFQQPAQPSGSTDPNAPLCPLFLASNGTNCPYGAACNHRHFTTGPAQQSTAINAQLNYMTANRIQLHDTWQEGLLVKSFKRGARFNCKNCGQEKPVSGKNDGIRCTPCFKRWCRGSD